MSAQMMISRIPVREAIKKLEQDDLVEKREKGGFIVKNPSREEIEETFGIRAVLEGYAAALADPAPRPGSPEETGGDPGRVQGRPLTAATSRR